MVKQVRRSDSVDEVVTDFGEVGNAIQDDDVVEALTPASY